MSVAERAAIERLVLHVVTAVNSRALYPGNHPRTREAIDAWVADLERVLEARGQTSIALLAVDDDLVVDQKPIAQGGLTVRGFVHALRRLGVEGLTLSRGLTVDEAQRFLEALAERSVAASTLHIQVGQLRVGLDDERGGEGGGAGLAGGVGSDGEGPSEGTGAGRQAQLRSSAASAADAGARLLVAAEQAKSAFVRQREQRGGAAQLERLVWTAMDALAHSAQVMLPMRDLRTHDELTFAHSLNVSLLVLAHGRALGLRGEVLKDAGFAALMHDIGKLMLPIDLLHDPGRLSNEQWALMRQHPELGAAILCEQRDLPSVVVLAAYEHHLRFDGAPSYPVLRSQRRPTLASALTAVADTFDAFCGRDPSPARRDAAFSMLRKRAGTWLDPILVDSFCRLFMPPPVAP
ncbi:MAG: HD domain-containing phosphohydrolase [Acidobacteriota bacterium]